MENKNKIITAQIPPKAENTDKSRLRRTNKKGCEFPHSLSIKYFGLFIFFLKELSHQLPIKQSSPAQEHNRKQLLHYRLHLPAK
jgi:hypothetical protein